MMTLLIGDRSADTELAMSSAMVTASQSEAVMRVSDQSEAGICIMVPDIQGWG